MSKIGCRRGIPSMPKKRHDWANQIPHLARCSACGLLRRQDRFPGGRGYSAYFRASARGELYLGSRAPACEPPSGRVLLEEEVPAVLAADGEPGADERVHQHQAAESRREPER